MYRVFGEIADPPDAPGSVPLVRGMLWARSVRHALGLDAAVVAKRGQRIADYLNPDGLFSDADRARRRTLHLGPQGPDGMSRLSGLLDPEARAHFEAIEAAVRPGRHRPDDARSDHGAR